MDSVFQRIYDEYHQDLYQFLFYMVQNREQTEDLVQEVYIRVLKAYERFEGKSSEKTWLFSIARNVAIDFFRKQKSWRKRLIDSFDWAEQQVKDQNPLPEDVTVQNEEIKLMYECLQSCTVDQRIVLVLRYIHSLSISETAESLGWTESKVKTTQHRAIKFLKKTMVNQAGKGGNDDETFFLG